MNQDQAIDALVGFAVGSWADDTRMALANVQLIASTSSECYVINVGSFPSQSLLNKAQDQLAQMNHVT